MTAPDPDPLSQLFLQFVLIFVNALFSSAEIALISFNEAKAEKRAQDGDKTAIRLLKLKEKPEKFLATIQIGITMAGFLASAFAANNFAGELAAFFTKIGLLDGVSALTRIKILQTASLIIITVLLSLFTIVLGELVPKRIAMKKAETLAYIMASPIAFLSTICAPIVNFLSFCTNSILRLVRIDPKSSENEITEEEIRLSVDAASARGAIDEQEKEIINNVFEFDDKNAGDLMTHRMETEILYMKDNDKDWEKTVLESHYSHYPVCGETSDDIIGVLETLDFLMLDNYDRKTVMAGAVHNPLFVPESIKADVLFSKMKQARKRFALVLDEYGGFSGVITMNDVLASIVGAF